MKYLKTFESYSVNENAEVLTPEVKSNIENKIKEHVAKLTPAQMAEVKVQLEDFAQEHGLTFADLQDVDKLSKVLAPELEAADIPSNESWLGDRFAQFKKWIGGFLVRLGLVGFAGTIIGAATAVSVVGESAMRNPEVSGPIGIGVGIAFAVSLLSYSIGASLPGEGKKMAQDIGSSTGRAMRS
jgi:hypothetical protein